MVVSRTETGFSPFDDCKKMLLDFVSSAQSKIRIADYSFNMDELVELLIEKKQAGLDVELILDKSQSGGGTEIPEIKKLKDAGVSYVIGTSEKHRIMHLKVVIVDDAAVGFGSYNFTEVAELESNVFHIEYDENLAAAFSNDWNRTYTFITQSES